MTPVEFRQVFQGGRKRSAGSLAVYSRANSLDHPRLGIAVSRKCARSAVVRNRIKRVIREAFRVRKQTIGGFDIVFLAQVGIARLGAVELRSVVDGHLAELEKCVRSRS